MTIFIDVDVEMPLPGKPNGVRLVERSSFSNGSLLMFNSYRIDKEGQLWSKEISFKERRWGEEKKEAFSGFLILEDLSHPENHWSIALKKGKVIDTREGEDAFPENSKSARRAMQEVLDKITKKEFKDIDSIKKHLETFLEIASLNENP